MILIEAMTAEHIPACVRILTENELWKRYGVTPNGAEHMFTTALTEGAAILTARLRGQTAGFAWYALHGAWDRSAYLRLIGILPEFQGQGIGEHLLQAVEAAAAKNVDDIFLLVTDSNTGAQRFYQRQGYRQVGSIPDYVVPGIAEFIFHKRLNR